MEQIYNIYINVYIVHIFGIVLKCVRIEINLDVKYKIMI